MPAHCLTSSSAGQPYLAGTKAGGFADEALECSLCLLVWFWLCKVLWPGASAPLDGSQTPHSAIPHPLANNSAELCVAAGISRGRYWVCLWAIQVFFMLGLACRTELEKLWSAAEPLPVVSVCSCSPALINTMLEAQVPSGARLIRALGRNRALQLLVGRGNTLNFGELWCCCDVQIFH